MAGADLEQALAALPHQPPMRLVERLDALVPGESACASRTARAEDWYFQGHFPDQPVVPAAVLVELLAQTGGLAASSGAPTPVKGMRVAAFGSFKFPAAALPGTRLEARARVAGRLGPMVKIEGEVTADGLVVAAGGLTLVAV
jgi:3-hydroxyacyl-[acyl-carrier-protein] dehydratase